MAYCELDEVKNYLGVGAVTDDALIEPLIVRAQKIIDTYTARIFECSTDTTRKFDAVRDVEGDLLYFNEDICSITLVKTNADNGTGGEIVSAVSEYITLPRYVTPYHAIRILRSSDKFWTYTTDPENGIVVTGKWAFSTTAPADIKHACIRLAGYLYRQKDAQTYDVTADAMTGMLTIPQGIPADVKLILNMYKKIIFGS